jgi:hypothetical protein
MSAESGSCQKKLRHMTAEDHARFMRLHEELFGRLAEMALILARGQGLGPNVPIVQFTVAYDRPAASGGVSQPVLYHQYTYKDGSQSCYDNVKKISCSGPCPC